MSPEEREKLEAELVQNLIQDRIKENRKRLRPMSKKQMMDHISSLEVQLYLFHEEIKKLKGEEEPKIELIEDKQGE